MKGISPIKMHKIIFFAENLKQILGFTSNFRYGQATLNKGIFYLALGSRLPFDALPVDALRPSQQ